MKTIRKSEPRSAPGNLSSVAEIWPFGGVDSEEVSLRVLVGMVGGGRQWCL